MNPFIDKDTKPDQPEYTIQGLSKQQTQYILSALDKLAMDANFINRKHVLQLGENLTNSFNTLH